LWLQSYLNKKIEHDEILPWFKCPAVECSCPIDIEILHRHLGIQSLYKFAQLFIMKHLKRNSNWISCQNNKISCLYGFFVEEKIQSNEEILMKCNACNFKQKISKNPFKVDQSLLELEKKWCDEKMSKM